MALSNVAVGAAVTSQSPGGLGSLATGTISPSSDCFLFLAGKEDSTGGATRTISTTLSNVGTWTKVEQTANGGATFLFFAWAKVTGAPGSGTITATFSGGPDAVILIPGWVTGYNTTTPLPQAAATATSTTGNASVTLGSTPTSTSEVIGVIGRFTAVNSAATITPGAGFTEAAQSFIWNTGYGFGIELEIQYQNAGSPPANVTATALGTFDEWTAIAVELAVAGAAAGVVARQLVHASAIQRASGW